MQKGYTDGMVEHETKPRFRRAAIDFFVLYYKIQHLYCCKAKKQTSNYKDHSLAIQWSSKIALCDDHALPKSWSSKTDFFGNHVSNQQQ